MYGTREASHVYGEDVLPFSQVRGEKWRNLPQRFDRQNAHSASVAANAFIQLYRSVSRESELHGKILVFSILHNQGMAKFYAHYAMIRRENITFHRFLIHGFLFTALDGREKWTTYRFVRKLYDTFSPLHLERIRDVISQLPESKLKQLPPSSPSADASVVSQDPTPSVPPSQDSERFVKRRYSASVMLKQDNDRQRILIQNLNNTLDQERERRERDSERQREETERQKEEIKREMRQQIAELKTQIESLIAALSN